MDYPALTYYYNLADPNLQKETAKKAPKPKEIIHIRRLITVDC
jgi:hypothetical protein